MEYRERAKNRKLKRNLLGLFDTFKLKSLNLTVAKKIVVFSVLVWFVALFFYWVSSTSTNSQNISNSFSDIVWRTWIPLTIVHIILLFLVLSKRSKDKIKLSLDSHIKDYTFVILWGIFIIISSINVLNFINWLQRFSSDLIIGPWVILEICAWIFITFWWFLMRKDFRKKINKIYINESEDEKLEELDDKNNMKLPI